MNVHFADSEAWMETRNLILSPTYVYENNGLLADACPDTNLVYHWKCDW